MSLTLSLSPSTHTLLWAVCETCKVPLNLGQWELSKLHRTGAERMLVRCSRCTTQTTLSLPRLGTAHTPSWNKSSPICTTACWHTCPSGELRPQRRRAHPRRHLPLRATGLPRLGPSFTSHSRARGAALRRHLVDVPARLARHGQRIRQGRWTQAKNPASRTTLVRSS